MRLLNLSNKAEGAVVARPIIAGHGGTLVAAGKSLSDYEISRLKGLGINHLYVHDEFSEGIEPTELVPQDLEHIVTDSVRTVYKHLFESDKPAQARINFREALQAVNEVANIISSTPAAVYNVIGLREAEESLYQHAFSSAVLAITVGKAFGLSVEHLSKLGAGMLLHDVGLTSLPPELLRKRGPLTPTEREHIKTHSRNGFQIAMRADISPLAANLILRHHETVDGSGYPNGLYGEELHLFARIASVCEVFDALSTPRAYGEAMLPDAAMRHILSQAGTRFDSAVAARLAQHVAPYPPGLIVRLSNGQVGIVVSATPPKLTQPVIRITHEPNGSPASAMFEVDLARQRELRIQECFTDFEPALIQAA